MEAKEKIRHKLELSDIIGEMVALTPVSTGRYKGLCPFHQEKTPSFHVMNDKGFYYCFGCQAKGDLFDFVMQTQGLNFSEALQVLGKRAGVEVKPPSPQEKKNRDLYAVNALALEYFQQSLKQHSFAQDYLEQRLLSPESIATFELGFAPEGWDGLLKFASQRGVEQKQLLEVGLLATSEKTGRSYDRFRNRIIFPIRDAIGRLVGFSGRVLDDSLPKYLNTPETPIFDKSTLLYGLFKAKPSIRESLECIVTEGYMDVIALHQTGFSHAVAALGATLTSEQTGELARLGVRYVYLAFDADEAGQRAILSGLEQSVGRQFYVRAVQMPQENGVAKDPADVVLSGDVAGFQRALDEGLSEVRYRFERVLEKYDAKEEEGKIAILKELAPAMQARAIIDPTASELRRLVVDKLELDEQRLDDWLKKQQKRRRNVSNLELQGLSRQQNLNRQQRIEIELMALMLREPSFMAERLQWLDIALQEGQSALLEEFQQHCRACDFQSEAILRQYQNREEGHILFERLFSQDDEGEERGDIALHIQKTLSLLREGYLEQQKDAQKDKLRERFKIISEELANPSLPVEALGKYYEELREINSLLAAREAERRSRLPRKR